MTDGCWRWWLILGFNLLSHGKAFDSRGAGLLEGKPEKIH